MNTYCFTTYARRPDLVDGALRLNGSVWPEFMFHDAVANRLWHRLAESFADYQTMWIDAEEQVVAVGNTVPLVWNGASEHLPSGWDDAFERAVSDYDSDRVPTTLCALQATVDRSLQGNGLSRMVLRGMRHRAVQAGLTALIAPVRPTRKSQYPLTPMERYLRWAQPDGSPFDPWLRTHWRLGAQIVKVAEASMLIESSIDDWEEWTQLRFPETGHYIVPGALNPIEIDAEADRGRYIEPNVWMRHAVSAADAVLQGG
ncbi:MAG TPA: GNAT family N-acetyltransferase [Anaerolineae bacterium]|nr:GNAT family N-acetyltransferase [Anaerolineae bacterium]